MLAGGKPCPNYARYPEDNPEWCWNCDPTKREEAIIEAATEYFNREIVLGALDSLRKDYEYQTSEENFRETCEANEYTFEANGAMRNN